MEVEEIISCLQDMRNRVIKLKDNSTESARKVLKWLCGREDWTNDQCKAFYESIIRYYIINDNESLELILAVSGLLDGYRNPKWFAEKRREQYMISVLDVKLGGQSDESTIRKQEREILKEVATFLKRDHDNGKISQSLINQWIGIADDTETIKDPNENASSLGSSNTTDTTQATKAENDSQQKYVRQTNKKRVSNDRIRNTQIDTLLKIDKKVTYNIFGPFWQSRKNVSQNSQRPLSVVKIVCLVLICTLVLGVFIFFISKGAYIPFIPIGDSNTENPDEPSVTTQNRVVNIDDPLADEIYSAYEDVLAEITRNPVMGDMFACGLRDLMFDDNRTLGDVNPWMDEFISKTDAAMALPLNRHPRGIERWMEYQGDELRITEEYRFYAAHICILLDSMEIVGVREWECIENWCLPTDGPDSGSRVERSSYRGSWPAIVLQLSDEDNKPIILIGICLYDQRLMVYDPETVLT